MSDRRRKYSSGSSDDSYEREKRKKSKSHHKEHRRKHKKEHRREEKRRSSSHERKKYRHDRDRHRSSKYDDRRKDYRDKDTDHKYKSKHEKYEHDNINKSIVAETKKVEVILPPVDSPKSPVNTVKKLTEDVVPSTSTNSDITLPSYYNSSIVNAQKFAEQQKKRKLLWQNKKIEETKWTNLKFSQDSDGTKANKFMRLMGIKDQKDENASQPQPSKSDTDSNKSDEMLKNMEIQYEVARNITHLSRGVGLGFK